MTWTKPEVTRTVRRTTPGLIQQAQAARTPQDADELEKELGFLFYMREKAHTTRCGTATVFELDRAESHIKVAIDRIRRNQG